MPHQTEVNPAKDRSEVEYEPSAVVRDRHSEGRLARLIEQQTAKLPSDFFLWTAFGAMGLSLFYEWRGRHNASRMVGMWAPTLLTMGVYNKVVKLIGSK
jgi:hypothetical protein